MKYFLAFLALVISIGLASFLVSFSFKGLPSSLKIDKDSIVKYQQDEDQRLVDFCVNDGFVNNYDYGFTLDKTDSDGYMEDIVSTVDKFIIEVPVDTNPKTSDLPTLQKGQYLISRHGDANTNVLIAKLDSKCYQADFEGNVDDSKIKEIYGQFSAENRDKYVAYYDEKGGIVRPISFENIGKDFKKVINGYTFVGFFRKYLMEDGSNIMFMEFETVRNNTLIIYMLNGGVENNSTYEYSLQYYIQNSEKIIEKLVKFQ